MGDYDSDRTAVIQRSLHADVGMVCVGTTLTDSLAGVRLAEQYPDQPVWAAVGVHPTDGDLGEIRPARLASLLNSPKVVAVGECGLDFFRLAPDDEETRQLQADVFEQHLLLAAQANKPLIIHTRDRNNVFDAYDRMLSILERHNRSRFVMHCYGGDWARAERFLVLGGYLSFTGIVTFPKSDLMQDVARRTPLDRMMIETDAPFLAPEPYRSKRNEPVYVELVAKKIAELRGLEFSEVAQITTSNTTTFFGLS